MDAIRITTEYTFEVVREAAHEYHPSLGSPQEAALIARRVIGSELSEVVIALMLDSRNRVMGYTEVAPGDLPAARGLIAPGASRVSAAGSAARRVSPPARAASAAHR